MNEYIAGVDEAGRGPLVGPVVAAAVILDSNKPILGLADSKKLTEKKRDNLYLEIKEKALFYGIGIADSTEIDKINILQATMLAMQRAVYNLNIKPNTILIDGNKAPEFNFNCKIETIVKGDQKVQEISAASILAKVTRDKILYDLAEKYPDYGFEKHKGYPTKAHIMAINKYGIIPEHRLSYRPVREAVNIDG